MIRNHSKDHIKRKLKGESSDKLKMTIAEIMAIDIAIRLA